MIKHVKPLHWIKWAYPWKTVYIHVPSFSRIGRLVVEQNVRWQTFRYMSNRNCLCIFQMTGSTDSVQSDYLIEFDCVILVHFVTVFVLMWSATSLLRRGGSSSIEIQAENLPRIVSVLESHRIMDWQRSDKASQAPSLSLDDLNGFPSLTKKRPFSISLAFFSTAPRYNRFFFF